MTKNKLIFLFILDIVFILGSIFAFYIVLKNIDPTATVTQSNDGSTVIIIKQIYDWKIVFLFLLFIVFDLLLIIALKIIQNINEKHIKEIYVSIIICIINLVFTILLFPTLTLLAIIIDVVIIIVYLIKIIIKKKYKNNGNCI